jgi:acetolactate synthase-1/2/3 large subunit
VAFCERVRELLPTVEPVNETGPSYLDPYAFTLQLSELAAADDLVVPCSSGGAFTVTMQTWRQKAGQHVVTDKGLASMGYGLSGAIGAALAHPGRRTLHLEGDGGFAQNLQEIATVAVNRLPLKTFLFANEGYASIRMTQRNYFGGAYLGCDTASGLGFPDWPALFASFGVPTLRLGEGWAADAEFRERLADPGPAAFLVPLDPEQTYFPKISSRVTDTGSMESNPLHLMSPELPDDVAREVFRYTTTGSRA